MNPPDYIELAESMIQTLSSMNREEAKRFVITKLQDAHDDGFERGQMILSNEIKRILKC